MALSHVKSDTIGDFTGTVTVFNSQGSTATVAATDLVRPSDWNSAHNFFQTISGNTSGTSTASGTNLVIGGTNGIQVSHSTEAGAATLWIQPSVASYVGYPVGYMDHATQTQAVQSNTSVVFPLEFHDREEIAFIQMPATVSISSMASIATAANNTKSYTQAATFNFVFYTRGTGASSQSLQSVASTSHSSQMTIAVGQNANGSQWTVTHAFSFPATNGSTSFSTSYATSLTNVNISTTHLTAMTGMKKMGFGFNSVLSNQQYWLAYGVATAHTTNGNASLSNMRVTHSNWAYSGPNVTWGEFGSANNASIQALYGLGSYTKAAVGTTDSIALGGISSSSSHLVPFVTFARIA